MGMRSTLLFRCPQTSAAPSMHLSRARFLKWTKILAVIGSCQDEKQLLRVTLYEKNIGRKKKSLARSLISSHVSGVKYLKNETRFSRWLGG